MIWNGVNVPEIQSLTSRIQDLDGKVGFWNTWYIRLVFVTVIAGVLLFFTQFMAMRRSDERDVLSKRLTKLKDDEYSSDKARLEGEAGKANERAGKLEKQAADLKTDNLRLEAAIAPRRLSERQIRSLSALTAFEGLTVEVKSYSSDTEGLILATQTIDALTKSKLHILDNRLTMMPAGSVLFGVSVDGPNASLVSDLRKALSMDGNLMAASTAPLPNRASISLGLITRPASPPAAIVTVGAKPIK